MKSQMSVTLPQWIVMRVLSCKENQTEPVRQMVNGVATLQLVVVSIEKQEVVIKKRNIA